MADKKVVPACCTVNSEEKKLVKATELPLHGNPNPPRDCIMVERPGVLEQQIRKIRTTLQPYFSPIGSGYDRVKDFVSVGVAHSQGAIHRLGENQNSIVNALVIATSGLIGIGLARKRGIIKKFLYGSVFVTGAIGACYPEQAKISAMQALYIAQNKLPELMKQKYQTISLGQSKEVGSSQPTDAKKE